VAREAGVSLKTASRVLNEAPYVNKETAASVRDAIASLGYFRNELARGLKARKSIAIGMVVPNLSDPFTANAARAVQEVARANGHIVILASSGGYPHIERSEVESLIRRQIDGLIVAPADSRKSDFSDIIPAGLHVVTFDQPIRASAFDSVTIQNRRSAKDAVQHLLGHGYKKIVAIGARSALYTCSERIGGYREAMKKKGLESRICLVEHESLLTEAWLSEVVLKDHKPHAIISMNWVCTMLTLRAMRQLCRHRNQLIPFLSFDDFELAEMMTPALSAVRQPAQAFGQTAANLLFERISGKGDPEPRSIVLATELILRESCGCSESHP